MLEEAIEMAEKARQIDSSITWPLRFAYRLTGRYRDALILAVQDLNLYPTFSGLYHLHVELTILYSELGRLEEAKAEAAEILKLVPNFSVEVYGERVPYKDPAQAERDMAALRKAGLK